MLRPVDRTRGRVGTSGIAKMSACPSAMCVPPHAARCRPAALDQNARTSNAAVTDGEADDVLAHLDDAADGFVAGDERELGDEFAFVNVAIYATKLGRVDNEQHPARTGTADTAAMDCRAIS